MRRIVVASRAKEQKKMRGAIFCKKSNKCGRPEDNEEEEERIRKRRDEAQSEIIDFLENDDCWVLWLNSPS
jgi:hypothetical protein